MGQVKSITRYFSDGANFVAREKAINRYYLEGLFLEFKSIII